MKFEVNVGWVDKIFRLCVGATALYFGYIFPGTSGNIFLTVITTIIALIAISVALTGFCPLYTLVNINTSNKGKNLQDIDKS